jgi:hypothetical protein
VAEVHNTVPDQIIRQNHYLKCTPAGGRHRYLITNGSHGIVGAAMWGRPVARNEDQEDTVELTRFWTADCTPKNTESWALGQMMQDLEEKGYSRLTAYASTGQGHEGTIYKATNWKEVNQVQPSSWETRPGRVDRDSSIKRKFECLLA